VRREDFNGKTADAATNGVGVSFLHQILRCFCGDFAISLQTVIDGAELAIPSFYCASPAQERNIS
jgi:hypothetical protein